jgi:hypothetical protein
MPSTPTTIKWKRGWKRHIDNKMRGAYGETDYNKKTIRINKARHQSPNAKRIAKKKDGSESLINTITHEEMHAAHPKMHEGTVRRKAASLVKRMRPTTKKRLYARYA